MIVGKAEPLRTIVNDCKGFPFAERTNHELELELKVRIVTLPVREASVSEWVASERVSPLFVILSIAAREVG